MDIETFCVTIFGKACFRAAARPTTYCSDFVSIIAIAQDIKDFSSCIYANDIITSMKKKRTRWLEVNAIAAQKAANLGVLVIAGWASSEAGAGGHVCVVIPGTTAHSNIHKKLMPIVCSVGRNNFYGKHAGYAFGKEHPPKFWLCDKSSSLRD